MTQDKKEYGYELALRLVRQQLAGIEDIERQCLKTGAVYRTSDRVIALDYINRPCLITLVDGDVLPASGGEAIPLREKILVLDYFLQAKGTPPSGNLITYKELKDGINYFPVFYKRAIQPLVNCFGSQPEQLPVTAAAIGGQSADYGDAAVVINAFNRIPVTLTLWKGDDEFPPEGSILFDSNVHDYLTNDDIHALCEIIAWKLVRLLKAGGDKTG